MSFETSILLWFAILAALLVAVHVKIYMLFHNPEDKDEKSRDSSTKQGPTS